MSKQLITPPTPMLIEDLGMIFPDKSSKRKVRFGLFRCHCGNEFKAMKSNVINGGTKGCGCLKYKRTHGLYKHPLHMIWEAMIQRTRNKNNKHFVDYGGRGIKVCEEWKDFKNFYDDMIDGYEKGLSIDRIDNDKGYEKSNCRWATMKVQQRNKRIIMSTNTSGYRGVSFHQRNSKWMARIVIDGKNIYLGSFTTAIEAAKAYNNYVLSNNLEHTINIL
jgi:hypothetical protein